MKTLDGPRIEPRQGRAAALVVLLHGYGSDGNDLIALGEALRDRLPSAAFVAPHAPERLPHSAMGGYQWFPLTMRDPSEYWRGATAAAPALDRFLDEELARLQLSADRLALIGFSQGTMMALHVGLRRAISPAAIVGFSGLLAGPEHLKPATSPPPIMLVHGDADDVVPVGALHTAREALAGQGYPVAWHVRPGLGHGIDGEGLRFAGDLLVQAIRSLR
jgi:phospholipase/carboxylesterase